MFTLYRIDFQFCSEIDPIQCEPIRNEEQVQWTQPDLGNVNLKVHKIRVKMASSAYILKIAENDPF